MADKTGIFKVPPFNYLGLKTIPPQRDICQVLS